MEKIHIEKNTVQETLVIPLFGRKLCTEQFPNLFQDPKAVKLIERIDYDFSPLEAKASGTGYRFGALTLGACRELLAMSIGGLLCFVFAWLMFRGYKRKRTEGQTMTIYEFGKGNPRAAVLIRPPRRCGGVDLDPGPCS